MKVHNKDRKKWNKVLKIEYMSSKDSDGHVNELKNSSITLAAR